MTCRRSRRLLSAYIDDDLGADQRSALDAHLADCAGCRQEVEAMRAVSSVLGALPDRAPAGLRDSILAAVTTGGEVPACPAIRQGLWEAADQPRHNLTGELARHLDDCALCRAEYAVMHAVRRVLAAAPTATPPVWLRNNILEATCRRRAFWGAPLPLMGWGAGAAGVVAVIALLLTRPQSPSTPGPHSASHPAAVGPRVTASAPVDENVAPAARDASRQRQAPAASDRERPVTAPRSRPRAPRHTVTRVARAPRAEAPSLTVVTAPMARREPGVTNVAPRSDSAVEAPTAHVESAAPPVVGVANATVILDDTPSTTAFMTDTASEAETGGEEATETKTFSPEPGEPAVSVVAALPPNRPSAEPGPTALTPAAEERTERPAMYSAPAPPDVEAVAFDEESFRIDPAVAPVSHSMESTPAVAVPASLPAVKPARRSARDALAKFRRRQADRRARRLASDAPNARAVDSGNIVGVKVVQLTF